MWLPDDVQFRISKTLEFTGAPVEYVVNAKPASFSGIFSAIPGIVNDANEAKPDLDEFLSFDVYDQLFNDDTDDDPLSKERMIRTTLGSTFQAHPISSHSSVLDVATLTCKCVCHVSVGPSPCPRFLNDALRGQRKK